MKYLILILLTQITFGQLKKDYMKFNLDEYENWQGYSKDLLEGEGITLRKGDDILQVIICEDEFQITEKNIKSGYIYIRRYDLNNNLLLAIDRLYYMWVGTGKFYKNGKLIKEIDYDKSFPFTIEMLRDKMLEKNIDIFDPQQIHDLVRYFRRPVDSTLLPIYEIKVERLDIFFDNYIIDGINGEILFEMQTVPLKERYTNVYEHYLKSLEKKNKKVFKIKEGKSYTKEEWELYEKEQYRIYQDKKNKKSLLDSLFNRK